MHGERQQRKRRKILTAFHVNRGMWLYEVLSQAYITLQFYFCCNNANGCIVIGRMQSIRNMEIIYIMCHL